MIKQATDSLNFRLLRTAIRPFIRTLDPDDYQDFPFLRSTQLSNCRSDELYSYLKLLCVVWGFFGMLLGLLCVCVVYILTQIDGGRGHSIGLAILLFVVCFCVTGAYDAAWRYYVLMAVRRYCKRASRRLAPSHPLFRLVRWNGATLPLQFAVGFLFAWRFS
jgi:hypothetical protein